MELGHIAISLNDSGPGSLRQAIQDAPCHAVIDFSDGLRGTIQLETSSRFRSAALTTAIPRFRCLSSRVGCGQAHARRARPESRSAHARWRLVRGMTITGGVAPQGGGILNQACNLRLRA